MAITLNGTTGITTPADTVTGNATVGGTLTVNGVSNPLGVPGASGNVLTSDGTNWTSAVPAGGGLPTPSAIGQIPFSTNGSTYTATQKITQGTAVASTSGTSIDFTGIPSWVKRVTVMFNGVSTSGTSNIQIQIGSTTITTSGYNAVNSATGSTSVTTTNSTGFLFAQLIAAGTVMYGSAVLTNISGNTWVISSQSYIAVNSSGNPNTDVGIGQLALSGALDRVRITTSNGTDTFDAGSINILYE